MTSSPFAFGPPTVAVLLGLAGCIEKGSSDPPRRTDGVPSSETPDDIDASVDPEDPDGDGFTEAEGDCDNTDPTVYPGAEDSMWHDRDCAEGVARANADLVIGGGSDVVWLGASLTAAGDLDGDGADDIAFGANIGGEPAVVLWSGLELAEGTAPGLDDATRLLAIESNGGSYAPLVSVGGDPLGHGGEVMAIQVVPPDASNVDILLADARPWIAGEPVDYGTLPRLIGSDLPDHAGHGVGIATDVDLDGDGFEDVVVGIPHLQVDTTPETGRLDVHFGDSLQANPQPLSGDADRSVLGEERGQWGASVSAVGDLDHDGTVDLLVGAPRLEHPVTDAWQSGVAYVLSGAELAAGEVEGPGDALLSVRTVEGDETVVHLGDAGGTLGDFTGDGRPEVYLSAWWAGNLQGMVAIFDPETLESGVYTTDDALHQVWGERDVELLGDTVEPLFDVDRDGVDDVIFANRGWGASHTILSGARLGEAGTTMPCYDDTLVTWKLGRLYSGQANADVAVVDLDGDHVDEVVLSGSIDWVDGVESGALYVVHEHP